MTAAVFFGCTFIAFGPAIALFLLTIAREPLRVIFLIAGAFFWLVSLLLASLVWFISVQISNKESAAQQKGLLVFGVVLSVLLQETFRFAYYKLLKKANEGLLTLSQEETMPISIRQLAYVSGLGFGFMSGAFSVVNILADSVGPGTVGIHGDSQHYFLSSAFMTMAIILLHMFWGVVFFDACEKQRWWAVAAVVISHLTVSCLTFQNPEYVASLVPTYVILLLMGVWAFYSAGALRDFDKKTKKEASPLLEQFLCHIAKTGETMVQWSQFKNYFLFKLENVMDDFRATAPDQRGPANPNVESIPFEDMKERILKIVKGYNGIPFTIQRLCELLTEPKRNYTGIDKFLRGVEKNVMVVSCVHPTSEKNGCSAVNRMNGVMLPGNTSAFTERKVNGPGTPRPLNRQPKLSLANSLAANGLPDSTDNKDLNTEQEGDKDSSEVSASGGSLGSSVKNKHEDEEEDMEAEQQEVKRLKFSEEETEEEDEDDEEEEQEVDTPRPLHTTCLSKEAEAEAMVQEEEEEKVGCSKENEASSSAAAVEDQEPTSSTQGEACAGPGQEAEHDEREVACGSQDEGSDMDQTEQQASACVVESPETSRDSEESNSDPVSSSSSSSGSSCSIEESAEVAREDVALAPSSSTTEPPTEGAMDSAILNTGTAEEPMEQD